MGFILIISLTIAETLSAYGYYGLFAGTFLSSLFLPMGSDILFIGMLANKYNPWLCLTIATLGNWLGGLVIYSISYSKNPQKIQRWFHIGEEVLLKQKRRVDKYGSFLALIVWIPVIGDLSIVALGFYRIRPFLTLSLMFFGRLSRFLLWIILYLLYSYRFVDTINTL